MPDDSPNPRRMKILLSAFVCEPGLGSEEGVGWGTAVSLAATHRVHVLTRPHHRAAIERRLAEEPCAGLTFSYFDFSPAFRRWIVTSALWQVYYHLWQNRIADWARDTAEKFDPDVVHHITYGRYWTPCSLWKLGRPFIWGPLGGGDACPPSFYSCLSGRERVSAHIRGLVQTLLHFDPALRSTARHATVAIASTPATAERLRSLGCRKVFLLLQMALDGKMLEGAAPSEPAEEKVFCSVGRLLGWKGHALTLAAFAQLDVPGAQLVIIGEGPARPHLEQLRARLGLDHSVRLMGALPRPEVLGWIRRATALVHSSFHDQAPTVVFEAMAAGTPVIALGLGGQTQQVTPDTGLLVPAESASQAARDMAAAMRRLSGDAALRARFAAAGFAHVRTHFTWGKKAEQFTTIYADALAAAARRPR